MDAKLFQIHKRLDEEDKRLLLLAQAVYKLLELSAHTAASNGDAETIQALRYQLDEAYNFQL